MKNSKLFQIALAALTLSATASDSSAQLANASAATLGQGGNSVATARGFAAVASNPAGLGMGGTSGFSLAVAPVRIRTGLDPVTFSNIKDFEGRLVPADVKEDWLNLIAADGSQSGTGGVRLSILSLSAGRVGFQISTLAAGRMTLSPGVAEAILYGNAGRTGEPTDVDITGSSASAYAITTGALSIGLPITSSRDIEMAVGATVTASIGHGVAVAQGSTGTLQSDPLRADINFPMLLTTEDDVGNAGSGFGLNVGFSIRQDRMSVSGTIDNVVNTFAWDETKVSFREGTAVLEEGNNASNFDEQPYANAPASLKEALAEQTFVRVSALGAAYDVTPRFRVMGEVRNRLDGGIDLGPKFHAGAGLEWRAVDAISIRAGGAKITDGTQLGGGFSIVAGPVHLSAAAARRMGDLDDSTLVQFTLSFGGN